MKCLRPCEEEHNWDFHLATVHYNTYIVKLEDIKTNSIKKNTLREKTKKKVVTLDLRNMQDNEEVCYF